MSNKVMIVGTGNVGASIGFSLVSQRTAVNELILTDLDMADAEGEVMDLQDTLAIAPSFLKIRAGSYTEEAADSDIIVLAAGAPQKPNQTRLDLLAENAKIFQNIITKIMSTGFNGIFIVVSNPVDVLSYLTWQYSGLPSEQVIGSGTLLDSARLRFRIAKQLNSSPKSIHAFQVGEHGDSEFTLWSQANFGGQKITDLIKTSELNKIETDTKQAAYNIIAKKGATYYGIGACVTQIINCILHDEKRVLPISSYDNFTDSFYGFPTVLGRNGVEQRLDLNLSEKESIKLQKSINVIKSALKNCR